MKAFRVASVTAALAVTFAGALSGCSGGAAVATSTPPAASAPCIPPGAAPAFTLVSPAPGSTSVTSPGVVLTAASQGNPPFTALLELLPPTGPAVEGGAVTAARPPPNPNVSQAYYSATYPALQSGISYDLRLHVTQYTNLPQACQKTFDIDLGTIAAR